jgi:hypothetical protein
MLNIFIMTIWRVLLAELSSMQKPKIHPLNMRMGPSQALYSQFHSYQPALGPNLSLTSIALLADTCPLLFYRLPIHHAKIMAL